MPYTPRELVRSAVGLAALMPGLALLILAVTLIASGGFGGVLAGALVTVVAVGLFAVALLMTHAPVTIAGLLKRDREEGPVESTGRNGHSDDGLGPEASGATEANGHSGR